MAHGLGHDSITFCHDLRLTIVMDSGSQNPNRCYTCLINLLPAASKIEGTFGHNFGLLGEVYYSEEGIKKLGTIFDPRIDVKALVIEWVFFPNKFDFFL